MPERLLDGEDDPVITVNLAGASPIFIVCEHAGRRIPRKLGDLGLPPEELVRHIAWDIGAEGVSRKLSALLDAPLVMQRYSRLVYDCNRPPHSPGAMPVVSETTRIPGNENLGEAERFQRIHEIYEPFHRRLEAELGRRKDPVVVAIHSFTPVFKGVERKLDLGILHDTERRLADRFIAAAERDTSYVTRRNEPYGPEDGVCHTLNLHTLNKDRQGVMIEVRHDLIKSEDGERLWADRLAELLRQAGPYG
jgi:predicted N-formylglutamate amidohydrolase